MSNQNKSKLLVVQVSEIREASDGRNYKVGYFQPLAEDGVFSNARPSGRTIWEEGPNGSMGDPIYPHLQKGMKVYGSVETIKTKPYFIENENGKFQHPETGHPANKVEQWTSVVFERESIEQRARNQENIELLDEDQGFQSTGTQAPAEKQEAELEMSITQ